MISNAIKLPYGLKDGKLLHIAAAEKGLACGCICPGCKLPLVARKGNINAPHFAHHSTKSCAHAVETAMHLACKAILIERREIVLPKVEIDFSTYRNPLLIAPEQRYKLSEIREESPIEDLVPDLMVCVEGHPLLIEIFVTHRVDELKQIKIERMGIATIEVDFSSIPRDFSHDALADLLVNQGANKKWLFNPLVSRLKKQLLNSGDRKTIIPRGLALHVDDCPIQMRVWHGKPYANLIDDCLYCPHALDLDKNHTCLTCGGRLRIENVSQLKAYLSAATKG